MVATVPSKEGDAQGLQGVPLFAGLAAAELQTLRERLVNRTYLRGDTIFHRDDIGDALYIIEHGQVKVILPGQEGGEIILAVFGPGEFFGEMALIDGLPRSATVVALQTTQLLTLYRADFLAALQTNTRLVLRLLSVLGQRVREANQMIEDIVTLDVPARLAKRLLDLALTHGVVTPEGLVVELRLTQGELASMIGATRESTNKVLRAFILRGWVTIGDHHVTICRPEELRRRIY